MQFHEIGAQPQCDVCGVILRVEAAFTADRRGAVEQQSFYAAFGLTFAASSLVLLIYGEVTRGRLR